MKIQLPRFVFLAVIVAIFLSIAFSLAVAASLVTHKGSQITVSYNGGETDAQTALSSLWSSVKQGSQNLWTVCKLPSAPSSLPAEDLSNIPSSFNLPGPGHHAKQILVRIDNNDMSAQGAILGISTELTRIKDEKSSPCAAKCDGNWLLAGGASICSSGTCNWASTLQQCDRGCNANDRRDPENNALWLAGCQPSTYMQDECSSSTHYQKGYSCDGQRGNCYYHDTGDCSTNTRCEGAGNCVTYCGNGQCDSGESYQTCSQDCQAPSSGQTIADGSECGSASTNRDKQCVSGTSCYDSNGDGVGLCLTPGEIAQRNGQSVCGDGVCDDSEVSTCSLDCYASDWR